MNIPAEFKSFNLPAIFNWAEDKFKFYVSSRNNYSTYDAYYWTFTGGFSNLRNIKDYYESKVINGVQHDATISIQPPHYRGQKAMVTIALNKYVPI